MKKKGYIYLVRLDETNNYKIGFCQNLWQRLTAIDNQCGNKMVLLAASVFENGFKIESQLKRKLHDKKAKNKDLPCWTEWFILENKTLLKIYDFILTGQNIIKTNWL